VHEYDCKDTLTARKSNSSKVGLNVPNGQQLPNCFQGFQGPSEGWAKHSIIFSLLDFDRQRLRYERLYEPIIKVDTGFIEVPKRIDRLM
jgi:hypothetical protein